MSDSEASSGDDKDEDADVLKMLKHLPNIFVQDALSERYGVLAGQIAPFLRILYRFSRGGSCALLTSTAILEGRSHLVGEQYCCRGAVAPCLRTLSGFLVVRFQLVGI